MSETPTRYARAAHVALLAFTSVLLAAACASSDPDGCLHADDTRATASTCYHLDSNGNRVYHPD